MPPLYPEKGSLFKYDNTIENHRILSNSYVGGYDLLYIIRDYTTRLSQQNSVIININNNNYLYAFVLNNNNDIILTYYNITTNTFILPEISQQISQQISSQICVLSNTPILTLNNNNITEYKLIKNIKQGDIVKDINGNLNKVINCGSSPEFYSLNEIDYPRLIPKDYFAENLPEQDLYASGWHAIYLPINKLYSKSIQNAIKFSKLIINAQQNNDVKLEFEKLYHKVYILSLTELKQIKTIQEIKEITGDSSARYYNIHLENHEAGYIMAGLPSEGVNQQLWDEFEFTNNA